MFEIATNENNLPIRHTMTLAESCNRFDGHCHEVPHFMVVSQGCLEVQLQQPNALREPIGPPIEQAPNSVPLIVPAEVWHSYKAKVPNTILHCLFPLGIERKYLVQPSGEAVEVA